MVTPSLRNMADTWVFTVISLIQRFGCALNLNAHSHLFFPDGVYVTDSDPPAFPLKLFAPRVSKSLTCSGVGPILLRIKTTQVRAVSPVAEIGYGGSRPVDTIEDRHTASGQRSRPLHAAASTGAVVLP